MVNYPESFIDQRPQSLCKMCGKCCRVVTTSVPYEDLKKQAEDGEEGAVDFLKIFVPYPTINDARNVDEGIVDNIINQLKEDGNYDEAKMTFYGCKFLLENNMCAIYAERPTLCRYFPSSPWAIVPPECGFEGWLFLKREEDKQRVRKAKEDYLELQLLKTKTDNPDTLKKIHSVEKKIQHTIDNYKKYGSENW